MNSLATRKLKNGYLLVSIFTIFTLFSGYSFNSPMETVLLVNYEIRAICLIILVLLSVILVISDITLIRFPLILFICSFHILYTMLIAIIFQSPDTYISSVIRWTTYLLIFLYFYSSPHSERLFRFMILLFSTVLIIQCTFDILLERGISINNANRIGASIGSAIGLAGALFILGLCTSYLHINTGKRVYLLFSILFGVLIVFTGTRSILVAYALFIPFLYFVSIERFLIRVFFSIFYAFLIACSAYVVLFYTDVGGRFLFDSIASDSSSSFRLLIIGTVINDFSGTNQILGLGIGGFPSWFKSRTGLSGIAPHLELLGLYTEGGLTGTALYVVGMLITAWVLYRRGRKTGSYSTIYWFSLICLTSSQTALQLSNPAYFYQLMVPLCAALGMSFHVLSKPIGLSTLERENARQDS